MPEGTAPNRLDKFISRHLLHEISRAKVVRLIRSGAILVNGRVVKSSTIIGPKDKIEIILPEETEHDRDYQQTVVPPPRIIFEDPHIVIVDKPPGLAVHHGAGRQSGTLMDVMLKDRPEMKGIGQAGRWGIVHRLDRDTSGVMVVGKTDEAYRGLCLKFKEHAIHRIYRAIVRGKPTMENGVISLPIGRHVRDRKKVSIVTAKARSAITRWLVTQRLGPLTLLQLRPETGRTHQIRVHLASSGLPILGDPVYGRLNKNDKNVSPIVKQCVKLITRQALHASLLGLTHPVTGEYLEFESPLPLDMQAVIRAAQMALSSQ